MPGSTKTSATGTTVCAEAAEWNAAAQNVGLDVVAARRRVQRFINPANGLAKPEPPVTPTSCLKTGRGQKRPTLVNTRGYKTPRTHKRTQNTRGQHDQHWPTNPGTKLPGTTRAHRPEANKTNTGQRNRVPNSPETATQQTRNKQHDQHWSDSRVPNSPDTGMHM